MAVDRDQALAIARNDAQAVYRDLADYEVSIQLKGRTWQVDYDLRDKRARGGGPHYLIACDTGEIVSKRYEQ